MFSIRLTLKESGSYHDIFSNKSLGNTNVISQAIAEFPANEQGHYNDPSQSQRETLWKFQT